MTKLALIFGTRPQIIKCVPVIREIERRGIDLTIINTGQHYDYQLSDIFLEELRLPPPSYNLGIGSGSHAVQTGNMMITVEKTLKEISNSLPACLIPGDTNSAVGSALAAVKLKMPVIHLESGLRANQEFLPEEINRKIIDHISQLLLSPTESARRNLIREGIPSERIAWTGDTMYDLFLMERKNIDMAYIPQKLEKLTDYVLLTLHREENTDDSTKLMAVMDAVKDFGSPVIFPIHPRTRERLHMFGLESVLKAKNLFVTEPLGYFSMMKLMINSSFVMTDSGGVQKEAFFSKVPCVTLRENTEWIETVKLKSNFLVKQITRKNILNAIQSVKKNRDGIVAAARWDRNPFGDGRASSQVVDEILRHY